MTLSNLETKKMFTFGGRGWLGGEGENIYQLNFRTKVELFLHLHFEFGLSGVLVRDSILKKYFVCIVKRQLI